MLRTTVAGLRAHKLRLLLTSLAISLGVAFIAGTFVLTDAMEAGFTQQVAASADKVDVAIFPTTPDDDGPPRLPARELDKVRAVAGVAEAQGLVRGDVALIGKDGKAIGDIPPAGLSVVAGALNRTVITSGVAPSADDQVVIDTDTARTRGFAPGGTVRVLDHAGTSHTLRVVGLFDVGIDADLAYRGAVGFTMAGAQAMTGEKGFTEIDVAAEDGVSQEHLKNTIISALKGGSHDVQTGQELVRTLSEENRINVESFMVALLLFGLVAMLVAALVIYNTFSILVAQRTRELALLRCIGATRKQIFASILLESAVVGALSSVLGLLLGSGLAAGAMALPPAFGQHIPFAGAPPTPRTIAIAIAIGVLVTAGAALLPARTATTVAPIAALRTQTGEDTFRTGRLRIIFAALFLIGGTGVTAAGVVSGPGAMPLYMIMGGGALTSFAVLILGPVIVRPLSAFVGWVPAKLFGVPGRLAMDNSGRNPKRAATTTIALTIGVTLMTVISVVTASTRATMTARIDQRFPVDYTITAQSTLRSGQAVLPRELAATLRTRPELRSVVQLRWTDPRRGDDMVGTFSGPYQPVMRQGSAHGFTAATVLLSSSTAEARKVGPGDTIALRTPKAGTVKVKVIGVFDQETVPLPAFTVPEDRFAQWYGDLDDAEILVNAKAGVSSDVARKAVEAVTQSYPKAKIKSSTEIRSQFDETLDSLLLIVTGLLGLAILISLLGIANTLSMSVHERTRESALLRALGLTRPQLRRMLWVEAFILGIIGAIVGVVLGVTYGWAAMQALSQHALFQIPATQVLLFIVLSGIAGVLAAVLPGRRAARASIVGSLATE